MKVNPVSCIANEIKLSHQAFRAMDSKTNIQQQQIIAVGKFNVDVCAFTIQKHWKNSSTLVHNIHNTTSSHERLFAGQQSSLMLRSLYANSLCLHHYSIN